MPVTSDVKLAIYNGALRRLGSRELASLSENREPRRVLDGIWGASDKVVRRALERDEWNFAMRTVEGIYSTTIEPDFGFRRAYNKPSDMRRLAAISADEYLHQSLLAAQYADEAEYWFTDEDVLYIRYVSDDPDYGLDSARWPEVFRDYLECDIAWEACERITNSTSKREQLDRDRKLSLKVAKSHDSMAEGAKFLPQGRWVRSRRGYWRGNDI